MTTMQSEVIRDEVTVELELEPVVLGAVAGDEGLTGSVCGCEMCDMTTDYAKAATD